MRDFLPPREYGVMKTKRIHLVVAGLLICLAGFAIAQAAFLYRCPKCGLSLNYTQNPIPQPKCPQDGNLMFRQ